MTTPEQVAANKLNAQKSCGPRTQKGKQESSMNALQHGGRAAVGRILPDEDPGEAAQFRGSIFEAYNPCGGDQEILVGLIADGLWRLQRLSRIETGIMTWHLYEMLQKRVDQEMAPSPERGRGSAESKKAELRRRQATDIDFASQAYLADVEGADALSKLSRYETAIANRVMGWMKELRELQSDQVGPA